MSVIIRLQNLPWSANALDVRGFFKGLSIPDGGVHIVGGEMGDAFIAFSTDEDARQAMMLNGGKIKEVQISLLLSSRAQMQKVIEEARRTTMSFMQLSAPSSAGSPQPPVVPKVTVPTTITQQPQPPVISLSGFLAQNLNQQKTQIMQTQSIYSEIPGLGFLTGGTGMFQPNAPAAGLFSALNSQTLNTGANNAAFTQLSEQLKKVTEAENLASAINQNSPIAIAKAGSTNSKKESNERSSRRSRSVSRDRERRRSSRDRSRSRSRDRGRRRSGRDRSRSRSYDRRSRSRSRDRRDRRRRSRSRDRRDTRSRDRSREKETKVDKPVKARVSRFSDRNDAKPEVVEAAAPSFVSPWETPIQQNLMKLANKNIANHIQPLALDTSTNPLVVGSNPMVQDNSKQLLGAYKANVLPAVNYGSFQASKPISNEHLSKLQELHARRDPRVFQNSVGERQNSIDGKAYLSQDNVLANATPTRLLPSNIYNPIGDNRKEFAQSTQDLNARQDSDDVDGQSVKISNFETITGYGEIRRFFGGQSISSNGIKMINDRSGKRTGVAYVRFLRKDGKRYALSRNGMIMRKSVVHVEAISDKEFEDAVDSYRPSYEESKAAWSDNDIDDNKKAGSQVIEVGDDSNGQDNKPGALLVWNLPNMTTELDLMKIFSDFTVVEVLIIRNYKNPKQLDGYVKFHRSDDARRACESTHKHYIRNKRVYVRQCTDIEYDVAKNEYETPEDNKIDAEQPVDDVAVVLEDSVHEIGDDTGESKKYEDDKMDLTEDDEDHLHNRFDNQKQDDLSLNEPTTFDRKLPPKNTDEEYKYPPNIPPKILQTDRDPIDVLSKSSHQQPQQTVIGTIGFGGNLNRDPRRRSDFTNQRADGSQSGFLSDNSRDSYDSNRNNYLQHNNTNRNRYNAPLQQTQENDNSRSSFNMHHQPPLINRFSTKPPPLIGSQHIQPLLAGNDSNDVKSTFIMINNLEYSLKESDIHEFFDKEGFSPKNIRIVRTPNGRSTGECLVEFETPHEASDTLIKNSSQIGNRKAFFKQLNKNQVMDVMKRLNQAGVQQNYQRGGNFNNSGNENYGRNRNMGRGNYENNNFGNQNSDNNSYGMNSSDKNSFGGSRRINRFSDSNSNSGENNDQTNENHYAENENEHSCRNDDDDSHHDNDQDSNNLRNCSLSNQSEQDDMKDQDHNSASFNREDSSDDLMNDRNSYPTHGNENIGGTLNSGGNIVALANLPFRAQNEDIVQHFQEYNITLNDVKRRYLPDGRTTGDAMVRFHSARDAQNALESHHQRRIGGRQIRMRITDN